MLRRSLGRVKTFLSSGPLPSRAPDQGFMLRGAAGPGRGAARGIGLLENAGDAVFGSISLPPPTSTRPRAHSHLTGPPWSSTTRRTEIAAPGGSDARACAWSRPLRHFSSSLRDRVDLHAGSNPAGNGVGSRPAEDRADCVHAALRHEPLVRWAIAHGAACARRRKPARGVRAVAGTGRCRPAAGG